MHETARETGGYEGGAAGGGESTAWLGAGGGIWGKGLL